mmetsp:Transcript_13140/g.18476  ORF Transcript_13140/g.18476 Transcript_13140/m.18476 type:complete len:256 (+) Transcript_13140:121-888(+)
MDEEQHPNVENDPLNVPEKIPFPWLTLAVVMCSVLGVVLLMAHNQKRKADDDFKYDSLGAEQYRFDLNPTDYYHTFKATFPEDAEDIRPLQKALLERALRNAPIVIKISQEGSTIGNLYHRSMISESAWNAFQESELKLQLEIDDVKNEAEELQPGWGKIIWQQAVNLYKKNEEDKHRMKSAEEEKSRAALETEKEAMRLQEEANKPTKEELAEKARLELEDMLAAEDNLKKKTTRSDSKKDLKKNSYRKSKKNK